MAIYQRGKSWYYDFIHKGQRYTGSFGPVSRSVAKEELARKKAEVIERRLNPAKARKSPRFDTFAAEYLEWVQANCKPMTVDRIRQTLKRLGAFVGSKRLNELTPWHFEQWKKRRREEGKAPGTINIELIVWKSMLYKALAWGKLADHPGKAVKLLKNPPHKTRFLSEEEEARLIGQCSPALRRIVQAGLLTGFRRQELASLHPEEIDWQNETVSVAACYAKNGERRTLPMGPRLKAVLHESVLTSGDAPTVFVNDYGHSWSPDALSERFHERCQTVGLEGVGFHVLRHTFASRLVMAGVDLRTVQELMGHKDIQMTLRYAHLSPHHTRSAMETLETRFSANTPATFHNTPDRPPLVSDEKGALFSAVS